MAKCDFCGSTILLGGKKSGDLRFCNARCLQQGSVVAVSKRVPDDVLEQVVRTVHRGRCPKCNGPGPIDVHMSHKVWSALALTSWRSQPQISCRPCGRKTQIGAAVFSFFLGWWGIPWGLVLTPVQIGRNLVAMTRCPDPMKPSVQLQNLMRLNIAANAMRDQEIRRSA